MLELKPLITSLDKDEYSQFIRFLKTKNKRNDTKNIELTSLLRNTELSSKEICNTLYKGNKTAFHALRKRLFSSIVDFAANTSIKTEVSTDMQLIKYLIAARNLLKKGLYKTGFYLLNKTEVIADKHQLYTILNEVYFTKIEHANHIDNVELKEIIIQFKNNQNNLILENSINISYAEIKLRIQELNSKSQAFHLKEVIDPILQKHDLNFSKNVSYKSLYQLIEITNLTAFHTFNYFDAEDFLINAYNQIESTADKEEIMYYKIEVLYIVANLLFRIKKFEKSLDFLTKMKELLLNNKVNNRKQFLIKHDFLLALNFNYTNKPEHAIALLESCIFKNNIAIDIELDIKLSLIVFYFQQNELQKARKLLTKFYHTDKWYGEKNGIIWVIQKNIIAILLHVELDNISLFTSKLLSFKRSYFNYLKEIKQERVVYFIIFIEKLFIDKSIVNTKNFLIEVESKLITTPYQKEDIFMMSFYAWLKAKIINKNLYETTLALVL